ncbi:MAG: curli production assembly protein CsgG [Campylobacteraceae bacterium]|nr:curli production assembly protein CsgG [Campylobacteraceae bacterium]
MWQKIIFSFLILALMFLFSGCAVATPEVKTAQPVTSSVNVNASVEAPSSPILKRKVAVARFANEAQYGKSKLFGLDSGYNAQKQATDIFSAKLVQSGMFIVLERDDIGLAEEEILKFNLTPAMVGADYLIVGSVTEFGRKTFSDTGVFSRKKEQSAYANVSVRLIDVKTGQVVFAQEGSGEATSEAGTSFGLGKHIGYDSTLNDKAISAAISSVIDGTMKNLLSKPWRSYVLSVQDNSLVIAGGQKQGVYIGDKFGVYGQGETITNPQTGFLMELPGTKIATIEVISQFGSSVTDEGSITRIVSGNIESIIKEKVYVQK